MHSIPKFCLGKFARGCSQHLLVGLPGERLGADPWGTCTRANTSSIPWPSSSTGLTARSSMQRRWLSLKLRCARHLEAIINDTQPLSHRALALHALHDFRTMHDASSRSALCLCGHFPSFLSYASGHAWLRALGASDVPMVVCDSFLPQRSHPGGHVRLQAASALSLVKPSRTTLFYVPWWFKSPTPLPTFGECMVLKSPSFSRSAR